MERIILDVDSAGDDILAILFAAISPSVKLEGVTTVCGAAGPIEQVTNVVLNTLALAGRQAIPVAAGAWRPIVGNAKVDMEAPVHFEKRLVARFGDRLKKVAELWRKLRNLRRRPGGPEERLIPVI